MRCSSNAAFQTPQAAWVESIHEPNTDCPIAISAIFLLEPIWPQAIHLAVVPYGLARKFGWLRGCES